MTILVPNQRLRIARNARDGVVTRIALAPLTSRIVLRIARETTASAIQFPSQSRLACQLIIRGGTEDFIAQGQATGGIRLGFGGAEIAEYSLAYDLPAGFFGGTVSSRLGERVSQFGLLVEMLLADDPIDTQWSVESFEAPPPVFVKRNSVGYDTLTAANELAGDGVLSLSHTAGGSDRAAFAFVADGGSPQASTSCTYNGNAMAEQWDVQSGLIVSAGYTIAGNSNVPASAVTVTSTIAGAPGNLQSLRVVSFTGVDSGTPVGTPQTAASTTEQSPTVTCTGLTTDGLIVDSIISAGGAAPSHTEGANQTNRNSEAIDVGRISVSTQSISDGGVMSWSVGAVPTNGQVLGAIEFKPAAGGGGGLALMGQASF